MVFGRMPVTPELAATGTRRRTDDTVRVAPGRVGAAGLDWAAGVGRSRAEAVGGMVRSAVRGSVIGLVVAALLTVAPVGAHGHGPEGRVRPSVGTPVGTPIALIFVAAALIFLPAVFGTAAVPPDDRWDG